VLIAPAMNVRMWEHAATRRNVAQLARDGINVIGPNEGEMACGEFGAGRMASRESWTPSKPCSIPIRGLTD